MAKGVPKPPSIKSIFGKVKAATTARLNKPMPKGTVYKAEIMHTPVIETVLNTYELVSGSCCSPVQPTFKKGTYYVHKYA